MSHVIVVIDDLLALSRIREAAARAGVFVIQARDAETIAAEAAKARLVLVDADNTRIPWPEAIASLRGNRQLAAIPVVAFLSHVAADRAALARSAGIERVLPRGAFVKELPSLLATAAGPVPEEEIP